MARVIEFYIPENYHPKPGPQAVFITRGEVIEFPKQSNPEMRRVQLLRDCSVLTRVIASEKNF